MAQYAREPRAYELMVILLPELAEENLTAAIDQVSTHIANINGELREVLKDSPWGRRRLAYSIRFNGQDYRDGIYVIWHFSADPASLSDLERELKLDTRVIRYLLVLEDPKWGSPQEREAARELAEAPAVEPEAAAVAPATDGAAPPAEATTEDQDAEAAQDAGEETPATATAETAEPAAEEAAGIAADNVPATEEVAAEAPVEESEAPEEAAPATEEVVDEQPAAEAAAPANDETSSEENQ